MDRVPPEIWSIIFKQLNDSRDFESASNSSPIWNRFLEPTKQCWLFGQAFPELLPYLSNHDVYRCRAVCRLWCYSVDYFLENNAFHRPAFEDRLEVKHWKTDLRPNILHNFLELNNLSYVNINAMPLTREAITNSAPNHPRTPIVGRAVSIMESPPIIVHLRNREFLQACGKHVWFLRIVIGFLGSVEFLRRVMELLPLVPNLKKLQVIGELISSTEEPLREYLEAEESQEAILREIGNESEQLLNLESLQINFTTRALSDHIEMTTYLLRRLSSESLKSLSINCYNNLPNFKIANIVDLSVNLDSDLNIFELMKLRSPVRKLTIRMIGRVHSSFLFQLVKGFRETLRNFDLLIGEEILVNGQEPMSARETGFFLEMFSNRDILRNMPNLKRVTLMGHPQISFNFLLGLNRTLEYLHVFMDNFNKRQQSGFKVIDTLDFTEEIDLLEYMRKCTPPKTPRPIQPELAYQSNVWQIFPKLKVLTICWKTDFNPMGYEVQYRRDVYEKLKQN